MPVLEIPALFASADPASPPDLRIGARVRFRTVAARRLKHCRRPRRTRLDIDVLTMSGAHRALLSSLTLYGASLEGGRRLRRREMVALRLPSGRRVQTRVRWRLGNRCGVQFLCPVADFARLLRESRDAVGASRSRRPASTPRFPGKTVSLVDKMQHFHLKVRRLSRQLLRWCRSL